MLDAELVIAELVIAELVIAELVTKVVSVVLLDDLENVEDNRGQELASVVSRLRIFESSEFESSSESKQPRGDDKPFQIATGNTLSGSPRKFSRAQEY